MGIEKAVNHFVKRIEEQNLQVEAVAVADERGVLAEHRFTRNLARNIYSHTKSYTAAAIGMAIDEGMLTLDDRLTDYFPEAIPKNAPPQLFRICLKHLLTMSSGFGKRYLMDGDYQQIPDYLGYMMTRDILMEPGSGFAYSNGDTYLAERMLEKATGKPIDYFLHERLFAPLKICWAWEHDTQGHAVGGSGLYLKLTDMLKLGQLYLTDGVWNGRRILSHDWIVCSSSKQIETDMPGSPYVGSVDCRFGYGYQIWMCPIPGTYRADGAYGQVSIVLPEQGLVVALQCPETGNFEKVKPVLYQELLPEIIACR